jgi:hypothetical protein
VAQKTIPAGKQAKVAIGLTAAGKPVAGTRVRLVGPGINKVVNTGKNGVASVSLNAEKAGIVTVTVVGEKSCSSTRLGVVGTFEPPVPG